MDRTDPWSAIPIFPTDVFAFCAYLVQVTGLMGYFEPDPDARAVFNKRDPLKIVISRKRRIQCRTASKKWRKNNKPDGLAQELWHQIQMERSLSIRIRDYVRIQRNADKPVRAPNWWVAVFELLIIADETCHGIGHDYSGNAKNKPAIFELITERTRQSRLGEKEQAKAAGHTDMVRARKQLSTLAAVADKGVVCVQPKGRVSEVGCTLRNISRNLAITGPVGSVRCSWQQLAGQSSLQVSDSLNMLLIPLPFELKATSFAPTKVLQENAKWGNFEVAQDWLDKVSEEDICDFVKRLINKAMQETRKINAIIFPEYALKYDLFRKLMSTVFEATKGNIEFMIAGSSTNCDDEPSNCVLTALWEHNMVNDADETTLMTAPRRVRIVTQKKHHRWKLDDTQITDYGLASSLPPYIKWWETHSIDQRELNFFQFRRNAVFASLICEDLARNDPCHEILRSVAPNLIIALLMDGPQLGGRWSARYASSLADDPGSTVLTLTSFGLIRRSNEHTSYDESYSVGLLRDDTGTTRELILPQDNHGILMTLASKSALDHTIDGRPTTNASSWHYVNQYPIMVEKYPWE